ncbi:centrosome-associated protein ALMS1 isoform X2 [Tenrec ecaudatus]|uniref:centrosome-associated protein ALMS1 isoform X2 n=1 Tax=Tenrec ecaudatus TaxID=94439 RepID=UPI003F5983F7
MEPEDLPWPSELEEEEEEEEEKEEEKEEKKKEEEPEDEVVVVEEVEGEERDLDGDFHDGSPRPESTDEGEDDDEEAKAWLQAPPSRVSPLWPQARGAEEACAEVVPLTCHVWQQGHQDNSRAQVSHPNLVSVETTQWGCADDQKTETWHCLPQETDNSQILGTSKTKFNVKEEGAKVTDSPSLEEGILTQSENRVKDRRKTFLCSPLLVIQDNFASPDLPLLTCPSQDREFGSNSLFQQSEPEFVPLRGVPDSSGDTEWFSRPSEVNEALLQATSEVASDRVSSCFSLSQYPLTGESQHSFLLPEEELHAEAISSDVAGERKTLKDSDSYDAPCSYMSLKTQDVAQQSGTKAAGRDLISSPSLSDLSDESTTLRGSGSCGACSYMQCWEEDASQPAEACLHRKDHDSFSDLSDTVDENETAKGNAMSGGPHSSRGWWTQGASPQPKPSPVSTEPASFPRDVTFHFNNQTPSSLLHLWERSGEVPLRSDNHYFESAYSKIPTKQEVKQKTGSLESDERSVGLGEGRVVSEGQTPAAVHVRLLEIQQAGRLIHPGDVFRVSEAYILSKSHGASKMEVPGGPLQTVAPNLAEAREQLCFQKDSNQKETSASGGKGLAAAESVAFEAVIASIESSKSGSAVDETHTDNTKSMTNDSPERAAEISAFSLTSYNDEKSLLGQLSRPLYQSTPGVFEPTAPKPLLPKEADDRPLYWHPDLKPQPNTFQELLTAEPTPSPLSETSHRQSAGPDRTQPLLIQGDISNEPFLPLGKIKSVSAFDLAEKIDSSEIHPVKVSSSETLLLQGLKPLSPEEVAASPLEHPQGKATSDIMTLDDDTDYRILEERAIVGKEKATELLREVDHSNLSADRSFSSTLSSIGSHETPRESEYHSPDLRMLRVSPESASKTLRLSAAWNLKLNLAHHCGYSMSELNEDDRRKVEEIKAKLIGHGRTDLSEGFQSPRGIGCQPEAVCSHIIIESHEKGCLRTLTAQETQLDSRPCAFPSDESEEAFRAQEGPSSWRARHTTLSRSPDQNNPRFKVWNSLRLQSHSPFPGFTSDNFKVSKDLRMPFHEKMDPWLSEFVEPSCLPSEGMDIHASSHIASPESLQKVTTSITFASHRHSKCMSDSSVFKVGVTEGGTGTSVGVFNSRFTEEQNPIHNQNQRSSSPFSFNMYGHPPDRNLTILAKSRKQSHKLPVNFEHAHQEEKLFRKSHFNISPFEPRPSTLGSNFISQGRRSSALRVKERNFAVTPDIPSLIFLEQRELFEQTKIPHANHHLRKHLHSPPQYQDYVPSNLPSQFPPEQQEPFEQNQALHEDSQMREHSIPLPPGQDCIALDLPSDIFLEQRKLLEQSSDPCVDHHLSSFPQDQECVMEKDNQHKPTSHIPELVNADPEFNNKVSHAVSDHCAPPLNRKAVSCVRITLSPKASSKLENGTSDKRVHKVDPVYTPRVDREFTSEQQTRSAITTEPSSTSKSSLDFHIVHFPITDSNMTTQDLKVIPSQGSQVEAARQTQANISNTDGSSTTERTPASANRAPEQLKTSAEKLLSDAVTQITTESPEKTLFSSEIFIKAEDSASKIPKPKPVGQPIRFASSSSIQHISTSRCTLAQPSLLPYKPSGCSKMYYVPQLEKLPQFPEARSDTTLESSHSGSNDAIAPEFPAQVLGTRDDDLSDIVSIKHKEGIYSKRAVGSKPCLKDTAVQVCITVDENLREKVCTQRTVTKLALPEETASLPKYSTESRCHSGLENTTHSVFRSAQFYFHHPVHLPSDQDFCHESLERGVFMRQDSCLSPPYQSVDKTKMDFTRIESLRINVNLGNKEGANAPKCQARDPLKCNRQSTDLKRDHKVTPEPAAQDTPTLNELWTQYQERQKHQKAPAFCDSKELSLVERLDRLARILQNPIAHSLQASDTGRDERREERAMKGWYSRPQQQNSKLLKKKRCKGVDRCHRNVDAPGKGSVLYTPQAERPNQIKFEHVKFNKYILRKQPGCNCRSNTSSESRPSEESELLTDTATNVFSTTTSPVESEYLTQTDKEVAVHERSSSISTIDTARLIQAFGHERVCVSPRRIKLYSSITNQQKRCLEKRCKPSPKAVPLGHFHVAAEHTRRRNIQVEEQMVSSDSVSSSASSFWNSSPILCNKQHVQMLNKGIQAGNLEIVNGARRHTRDVGLNVPTPSSSEAHLEEDSDGSSSLSEIKIEEKRIHAGHPPDRKSRRSVTSLCEGISWFVPAENLKCGSKKENLPRFYGPAVSWFEAVTNTKPWREPLREKNWQGQRVDSQMDCGGRLADPCNSEGMHPLRPFVRASLQEALHFHRPDFISRSGERIKRLKLIVQERKLQNVLQSEREALFNTGPDCPGSQRGARPRARQGFLAAHKSRAIGKKEMIQRSKRMYEQLPEVQKRKEEEKRQSEYKCYRLRAQLYKKKVTNRLLGRKVPWD